MAKPVLLACGLVLLCPFASAAISDMSLAGRWMAKPAALAPANAYLPQLPADNLDGWQPLDVPNNWYLSGLDTAGAVWHRRTFDLPAKRPGKTATLVFSGVDYYADVWLNGTYLGSHEGYFQPFQFDVSHLLKRQHNVLVVRVDSPDEMPGSTWSLHKRLIKGVLNDHDTRPGGAWSDHGQDANSGGIWAPVGLHFSDGAVLTKAATLTHIDDAGNNAALDLDVAVSSSITTPLHAAVTLTPANFSGPAFTFDAPISSNSDNQLHFALSSPERWWPAGCGAPNLYTLRIALLQGQRVVDVREQRAGFRSLRYDESGHAFVINGRRLFLRGTNYIGSPWLAEMGPPQYARDLDLMLAAGINAVRVHAHVAGAALYDQADERGLLLWQDFPLQWGYDDSPAFAQEAARQAGGMLDLLSGHPGIFAWSGQNEPPWDADWMQYKYPDYDPRQNHQLTARVNAVLARDPTRFVHSHSATGEHMWFGWYSGEWQDHAKPTKESLVTEFGAQALPDLDTLKSIIPGNALWPASTRADDKAWADWEYHDFQLGETFSVAKVERGSNIAEFIANSQQYQARLTQLAAESYRRQRYAPVAAAFQFMFAENWPSINWGILDYKRHPKPGYAALARAFQPVLPSIEWAGRPWPAGTSLALRLWAINDRWQDYPGARLHYQISNASGTLIAQGDKSLDLLADSGSPVLTTSSPALPAGTVTITTSLLDQQGHLLGKNQLDLPVEATKP